MIKNTMICDRCKKEVEEGRYGYSLKDKYLLKTAHPTKREPFDLCQKCYDELINWIQNICEEES